MTVQGGGALTDWWTCRRSSSAAESESIDQFKPLPLQEAYWCVSLKLACGETIRELTDWLICRITRTAAKSESIDEFEPLFLHAANWLVSF